MPRFSREHIVYEVNLRSFSEEVHSRGELASLYRHGQYIVSFLATPAQRAKIRRRSGSFRIMSSQTRRAGLFYPGQRVARGVSGEDL